MWQQEGLTMEVEDLSESEEDMAEMEAMLYSKIHYEENLENTFEEQILPQSDATLLQDMLETKKGSNETPDSGFNSMKSSETSSPRDSPQVINLLDDTIEESRCDTFGGGVTTAQVDSGADSSEDSDSDDGIQIVSASERTPVAFARPPSVISVHGSSSSSSSDSEVEVLKQETNRQKQIAVSQVSEVEEGKQSAKQESNQKKRKSENQKPFQKIPKSNSQSKLVVVAPKRGEKRVNKKFVFKSNSSSDESSAGEDVDDLGLSLNVSGLKAKSCLRDMISDISSDIQRRECRSWTPEMRQWYNEIDHELADREMEDVHAEMSDDPDKWKIDVSDRLVGSGRTPRRNRYFNGGTPSRRCNRCNELGHLVKDCTEPARCNVCYEVGHMYYGCPNKLCLHCGDPVMHAADIRGGCGRCRGARGFECFQCGGSGHLSQNCPDNWRRYHASIEGDEVRVPERDPHRESRFAWCPNCAKQGHYVHECSAYSYSQYPVQVPYVVSYQDPVHSSRPAKRSKKRDVRALKKDVEKKYSANFNPEALEGLKTGNKNWRKMKDLLGTPKSQMKIIPRSANSAKKILSKCLKNFDQENSKCKAKWKSGKITRKVLLREISSLEKLPKKTHLSKIERKRLSDVITTHLSP